MMLVSEDWEDRKRNETYKTRKGKPISWYLRTKQLP